MRAAEALAAGILALLIAPHPGDAAQGVVAAPSSPAPERAGARDPASPPERRAAPAAPRPPAATAAPPSHDPRDALMRAAQAGGEARARPLPATLTRALRRGAPPSVSYEIAIEIDPAEFARRDAAMRTPLHHAAELSSDPALITLMIRRGAEIMARDAQGRTPLHAAAENPKAAAALLAAGADACEPDVAGRPALDAGALERIRSEATEAYDAAVAAFVGCL